LITSDNKIVRDRGQLTVRLSRLPRPYVFTNGCFDILHRGHVAYLEEAALLGSTLIVAVNSDESVRRLEKGGDRPINPLEDRMAIVAALGCVSLVVAFDQDTPLELIETIKPDRLVKGGDWTPDKIVGADVVRAYGGSVHSIPFRFERSTTALLNRIRSHG
jgi:rfaE bifunctional protein nucleotidyltransferase chain/domain